MNQILSLLFGLLLGLCLSMMCFYPQKVGVMLSINSQAKIPSDKTVHSANLYNETLAEKLFNEVRILCWIATSVENHKKKAKFVKKTWGKRCNKLLFMSTKSDADLGTIALPVKEGRDTLWDKTKNAFLYVYKHHADDADWFLKADDDK
jgi:glycoprotein-N-acetylgalactosamine 3-beta-galactosyltransferase